MSKQRKFVLIAAAVGVIATFLPWWSVSVFGYTSSANGFHSLGILAFLCFVASGVMSYLDDQTKNLDKSKWAATLIAGAVAVLIVIYYIIDAGSFAGFGMYIAGAAAIGILASAFMFRTPGDTISGGFDSFKKDLGSKISNTGTSNPPTNTGSENQGNTNPPA